MSKNLVIVESPAKAKTIEKFLGSEYHVLSSQGHVRDIERRTPLVLISSTATNRIMPSMRTKNI